MAFSPQGGAHAHSAPTATAAAMTAGRRFQGKGILSMPTVSPQISQICQYSGHDSPGSPAVYLGRPRLSLWPLLSVRGPDLAAQELLRNAWQVRSVAGCVRETDE